MTEAEQLQVDATAACDNIIVCLARLVGICFQPVGHECACFIDVDMVKQVMVHKVTVALVVVRTEPLVFIQVDACNVREIKISVFIRLDQVLIRTDGRRSCRKAKHAVRLQYNLGRDDIGGFTA